MADSSSYLGLDLSLNHAGAVVVDTDGRVVDYRFVSDKKGAVQRNARHGIRAPQKATKDAEQHQLDRMNFHRRWISDVTLVSGADYVGLEGYAFAAVSNSSYQYGELGGLARYVLTRNGCKVRIHDPQSIKMWATGKGNALAADLLDAMPDAGVRDEWKAIEDGLKGQQAAEDLAVAYWIAHMVASEVLVRRGVKALVGFPEHRVRVFNRITKTYPANLLDREWLHR